MDLNTGRSWATDLNFAQYSLGFGTSYVGLVTGLGIEFNNYYFDHDNSITESVDDQVIKVDLSDTSGLVKSKLFVTFIRVPLLLEFQFPRAYRTGRVLYQQV